jgi:hypothetical protein
MKFKKEETNSFVRYVNKKKKYFMSKVIMESQFERRIRKVM